jgi:glutamate dehydrogenase/leucine dehydrogenase
VPRLVSIVSPAVACLQLFRAFGRYVEGLHGRYFTAEDVGTDVHDMEFINMESKYVTGIDPNHGGSGDPSPFTAHGVLMGIKACVKEKFQTDSLKGVRLAVQCLIIGSYNFRCTYNSHTLQSFRFAKKFTYNICSGG